MRRHITEEECEMSALTRHLANLFSKVRLADKPRPEPEPVNAVERPMTGLYSSLSADQKKRALSYRGNENHGDPRYRRRSVA